MATDNLDLNSLKIDRGAGRRRKRRSPWLGRLILLALVALGLWVFQRPLVKLVDDFRLPTVSVEPVLTRSAAVSGGPSGAAANGYVIARTRAALSSDFAGRLVELNVVEGSVVKQGDVVARLYFEEFEAALHAAEADLRLATATRDGRVAALEVARTDRRKWESERATASARVKQSGGLLAQSLGRLAQAQAELILTEKNLKRTRELVETGVETPERLDVATRDRASALAAIDAEKGAERASNAGQAISVASKATVAVELEAADARVSQAQAALAEAEAGIAVASANRDAASATLEKTHVRAPFDGVVVQKEAEIGEVVSPNSQGGSLARGSVVTMVDLRSLEVQADVPETTLAAVKVGEPATIYLDAFPDTPYAGRIDRIWPMADRQKATVEVRVAFEELDAKLRPEMGVRVVFGGRRQATESAGGVETPDAVVLAPRRALVRSADWQGVFVVERGLVRARDVVAGEERSGRIVILQGLSGGEQVVVDPPDDLKDGDRVRSTQN